MGPACTHAPQATQLLAPIGSSKSNTIVARAPRWARPMTSFTCTSRQARTHRPQVMQASSATWMAGWERSAGRGAGASVAASVAAAAGSCICSTSSQKWLERSGLSARAGWCSSSSSSTPSRACRARVELALRTTMPGRASRMQEAARVRSPSISTMQARQLPSAR